MDQKEFDDTLKKSLSHLGELNATIKKISAEAAEREKQIEAAEKHRDRWAAKLHLIRRGVEEALVRKAQKDHGIKNEDGSEIEDDPEKLFQELLKEKFKPSGEGTEVSIGEMLKGDPDVASISRIFKLRRSKSEWKKFLNDAFHGRPLFNFGAPPGIDAEILMLGADLGRLNRALSVDRVLDSNAETFARLPYETALSGRRGSSCRFSPGLPISL